jgi:type III restriction enzyme
MDNRFFERPIINSPYKYPAQHWELDSEGQPTQQVIEARRRAEFITPIPKPRKHKATQETIVFDEGRGLSSADQQYDPTPIINDLRGRVDQSQGLAGQPGDHTAPSALAAPPIQQYPSVLLSDRGR